MPLNASQTEEALNSVAAAIKRGMSPDHFEGVMNKILGTEMDARDVELEGAWEAARKRRDTE